MKKLSSSVIFSGKQEVFSHKSAACECEMNFGVFFPPEDVHGKGPFPVLYWLSGLTCTHENFISKAGAQRIAAELGIMIVAPDTSPRGADVPDAPDAGYDLGLGAGFYVDANEEPWARHYQMYSYAAEELPALIENEFPADPQRCGVFGHSMGGHGALVLHLNNIEKFKTCSAFAPITAPVHAPWGRKAFSNYLGTDESKWSAYDACALVSRKPSRAEILIDQGARDEFLSEQLMPERFTAACQQAGQRLTLRMQAGYDHSYYFISTFVEDHLRWHFQRLNGTD